MLGVIAASRRKIREDYYQLFKDRVLEDSGTFIENPIVFNREKLLLTPNAYKEDVIYAALPIDGSGDFTFSRNSSATYIEDDIIKTALPNVPRIQDGRILIEEQATNLLINSVFDGDETAVDNWSRTLVNGSYSLIGNETIRFSSTDGRYLLRQNVFLEDGVKYTYSVKVNLLSGEVPVRDIIFIAATSMDFTLNGVPCGNLDLTPLGENYIQCEITGVGVSRDVRVGVGTGQGNKTAEVEIKQPQLEKGILKTSYIPTTTTAVTRLSDIATVDPPTGVTEIIETIDGVEQPLITTIPPTYQLPVGGINNVKMK